MRKCAITAECAYEKETFLKLFRSFGFASISLMLIYILCFYHFVTVSLLDPLPVKKNTEEENKE